jgi:hypothetical protein
MNPSFNRVVPTVQNVAPTRYSYADSSLSLQLQSFAARLPTTSNGAYTTSPQSFVAQHVAPPAPRLDTAVHIHEAIAIEKIRLVNNILRLQQQTTSPKPTMIVASQLLVHSPRELDATRIFAQIGSQIRTGHAYMDVTMLPGIKNAEAVTPRTNRGGHIETFPQVRRSKAVPIREYCSFVSASHNVLSFSEAPSNVAGRSRQSRHQHRILSSPRTSLYRPRHGKVRERDYPQVLQPWGLAFLYEAAQFVRLSPSLQRI